jgi:hypothetical protein
MVPGVGVTAVLPLGSRRDGRGPMRELMNSNAPGDMASPHGPTAGAGAESSRGFLPAALPPPLPRRVLPVDYAFPPRGARPRRWSGAVGVIALVTAVLYFAGMLVLNSARDRPAGAPTASDLVLACGVFPLALIFGLFLLCGSFAAIFFTPGRARVLPILAVLLTIVAFVLAFPSH